MNEANQNQLTLSAVVGTCALFICFKANVFSQTVAISETNSTRQKPKPTPTSIPGLSAVAQQAYAKNSWDCGAIQAMGTQPTFNNDCSVKAWKMRKPFRLRLGMYERSWGAYNGVLLGDKNRRLFLALDYSSVNGIWRIEKEIKNAFVAPKHGKEVLFWKDQKQDFGITYPG